MSISPAITDDPDFVEILNALVRGLIAAYAPEELWLIHIDNWFDHRWLKFSGIGIVDFEWPAFVNRFDAALDEFHQDKLTFPPFAPKRVLGQWSYVRSDGDYVEVPLPKLPHATEKRRSEPNLQRRVEAFSRSACFVWYSGNTKSNGKGSVMVYRVERGKVESWFAAFHRQAGWKLHATKGASKDEVQRLLT